MHGPHPSRDYAPQAAELHARVAVIHESSARVLRAHGRDEAAERVERFARDARNAAGRPAAMARMAALARRVRDVPMLDTVLDEALDSAMAFLAADFGNIQLVDPSTEALRIVCHRGFDGDFLDHFAVVDDGQAACGRAATAGRQVVIGDVRVDPAFAPHRAIAAASGFRAVQSTPLIDRAGGLRGVLSTHFRRVHRPPARALRVTQNFGQIVADALAAQDAA